MKNVFCKMKLKKEFFCEEPTKDVFVELKEKASLLTYGPYGPQGEGVRYGGRMHLFPPKRK